MAADPYCPGWILYEERILGIHMSDNKDAMNISPYIAAAAQVAKDSKAPHANRVQKDAGKPVSEAPRGPHETGPAFRKRSLRAISALLNQVKRDRPSFSYMGKIQSLRSDDVQIITPSDMEKSAYKGLIAFTIITSYSVPTAEFSLNGQEPYTVTGLPEILGELRSIFATMPKIPAPLSAAGAADTPKP